MIPNNQFFYNSLSGDIYTPLLDMFPGASMAYSYSRKLSSSYAGSCIEAYGITSGLTQNIGFDNNEFDEAALLSWGGAQDLRSRTLYDQSGNAKDLAYSVVAFLPRVANLGVVEKVNSKVSGNWTSAGSQLIGVAADWKFLHVSAHTIYMVVKIGTAANPGVAYPLFGTNNGTTGNNGVYFEYQDDGANNDKFRHIVTNASGAIGTSPVNNSSANGAITANSLHVLSFVCDPSSGTASVRSQVSVDGGAAVSNNTNNAAVNNVNPPFGMQLGGYGNNPALVGSVSELIFYPFTQTPTDNTSIVNNIKTYYGIA